MIAYAVIRHGVPGRAGRIPLEGCSRSERGENSAVRVIRHGVPRPEGAVRHGGGVKMGGMPPKKSPSIFMLRLLKLAATHFPTWYSSIIGVNGLNFSVRDGKRWIPVAVTT